MLFKHLNTGGIKSVQNEQRLIMACSYNMEIREMGDEGVLIY